MPIRFHTTDSAQAILHHGFRDSDGAYGFASTHVSGVFLSLYPASVSDGANGEEVLEVTLPEDFDLDNYAIIEIGTTWEWLVPAKLLNEEATIRLMSVGEVDAAAPSLPRPPGLPDFT